MRGHFKSLAYGFFPVSNFSDFQFVLWYNHALYGFELLKYIETCFMVHLCFVNVLYTQKYNVFYSGYVEISVCQFYYFIQMFSCLLIFVCFFLLVTKRCSTKSSTPLSLQICLFPLEVLSVLHILNSVQFSHSVMSNLLQPHGLQHTRLPCPPPTPRACSN